MAAKTGIGVVEVVNQIESIFREWATKAANLKAKFDAGQPVAIDNMALSGYHDARRAIEVFDAMQARITAKSWQSAVIAEGVTRHGAGYDIVAEAAAFRTLLVELQALVITAVGGVDANGYITAPYIKLTNTGPYFNTVSSTDYAPVNAKMQEILASIEE